MDVWIGDNYERSPDRILVLGESWYDDVEPLPGYVPRWVRGEVDDKTFSRLFNAASGWHTERATVDQRLAWWGGIAFYNFVPGSVGKNRSDRPSRAAFVAACDPLAAALDRLRPKGVWIIGKGQAKHSVEIVRLSGAAYEVTRHPTAYGVSTAELASSWATLLRSVRG